MGNGASGCERERLRLGLLVALQRIGQRKGETAARTWRALQPDTPAMQGHELAHQWQPESRPLGSSRSVRLTKPLENHAFVFRSDPDAGIAHGNDRAHG